MEHTKAQAATRRAYTFTPAEVKALGTVFGVLDMHQARLEAMLTLVCDQQGLAGGYLLNPDRTGLLPKD